MKNDLSNISFNKESITELNTETLEGINSGVSTTTTVGTTSNVMTIIAEMTKHLITQ